ncbi:hypothetical protein Tsp_07849 [Trichinella spiralis]|uniref:hypothetical protein n=1 Tax=Trichinella spiralis TaxID=6334 RepID=UPI0001EFD012|nr:hypothetical protein Tsp_07849 [Trichinella spiralis]
MHIFRLIFSKVQCQMKRIDDKCSDSLHFKKDSMPQLAPSQTFVNGFVHKKIVVQQCFLFEDIRVELLYSSETDAFSNKVSWPGQAIIVPLKCKNSSKPCVVDAE